MRYQPKPQLSFAQLKAAFAPFGLPVEETRMDSHSSAVKIVHDGVPYTIDCYHELDRVSECAAKFYIMLERHHEDIKRLYNVWQPLCDKPMHVMSGGGLQLQAFFSTPGRYQGILYLSHIDDGRFQEIEKLLGSHGVPFTPYKPDETLLRGPHSLRLENDDWLTKLPLVANIKVSSWNQKAKHTPPATEQVAAPPMPMLPTTPNPYGGPDL